MAEIGLRSGKISSGRYRCGRYIIERYKPGEWLVIDAATDEQLGDHATHAEAYAWCRQNP